jgi:Fe-S-cluster containining protein
MAEPVNCQSCGACCGAGSEMEGAASVDQADMDRMGPARVHLYVLGTTTTAEWRRQRGGPLAGQEALVCSALRGDVFERVSCAMYESRPTVCRQFEAGSTGCHAARRAWGVEGVSLP